MYPYSPNTVVSGMVCFSFSTPEKDNAVHLKTEVHEDLNNTRSNDKDSSQTRKTCAHYAAVATKLLSPREVLSAFLYADDQTYSIPEDGDAVTVNSARFEARYDNGFCVRRKERKPHHRRHLAMDSEQVDTLIDCLFPQPLHL